MNYHNITAEDMHRSGVSLRVGTVGSVVYVAVYTPIIFMCIFGNALVLNSFIRFRELRQINNNYYIFALAITDFLTGLFGMPLAIANRLVISDLTCHARSRSHIFLPAYVFTACSMCTLLGITVDRYIAISRPLRYHVIMTSKATIKFVALWYMVGILFGTLPIWSFGGDPHQWVCELQQYDAPILTVQAIIGSFLIPTWLFLLIMAYARIFHIAYLRKDTVSKIRSRKAKSIQRQMRMRTTITSAIVLVTFTVFWLPHSFKNIFEIYLATDLKSLLAVQTFCEMLTYISAFMNPIIYGWRNQQFRTAYKNILNDWFCRKAKLEAG